MSQENVELVRRIYDAWSKGESADEYIDPDVEYVNPPYAVEPGVIYGRDSFRLVSQVYEDVQVHPQEFLDAGDDVVVLATITGRGRGSGVEIERSHGYVWTIRDGQGVRFRWFNDHNEAKAAAGLYVPH